MLCSCLLMRPYIRPMQLSSRLEQGIRLISYFPLFFFLPLIHYFYISFCAFRGQITNAQQLTGFPHFLNAQLVPILASFCTYFSATEVQLL